jgi:hypothetical protein
LSKRGSIKTVLLANHARFFPYFVQKCAGSLFVGKLNGEKLMSTDLKYSLFTTVIVLSLIVFGALTAALH